MNDELQTLREALLDGLRVELGPDDGRQAFERHQLLAIRFHRAARLNVAGTKTGEQRGWCQYFEEHFPRGGEHGELLFTRWRTTLLKDEMPGRGVLITHGQAEVHWLMSARGLVVNLESMWNEFEASVDHLLAALASDDEHRTRVLAHFEKTRWTVRPVEILVPRPVTPVGKTQMIRPAVSAVASATAMASDAPALDDATDNQT
jgi:hypothetical protein